MTLTYFGVYFVLTQFALLGLLYVFTRVDFKSQKWQWLPRSSLIPEQPLEGLIECLASSFRAAATSVGTAIVMYSLVVPGNLRKRVSRD